MNAAEIPRSPLARRLREARVAKGISQRALGVLVGIDAGSASPRINQYESDKHLPDYRIAERLAECLDVPVTFFYAEDERLAKMILAFSALSPREQNSVLKAAQEASR